MDIVFLGAGAFGLPSLEALAASGHRLLHLISQPDRPAGRGNKLTATPVSTWAIERGLPLTRTADVNAPDMLTLLRELKADCFVVIAFGQKLSNELLAIPPKGSINLHSSLLPRHRGAAPINWAILSGDKVAGVSVIEVTPVMDAGALMATVETPIGESETAGELHDRLALLGAPLLPRVLDEMAAGREQRVPQDAALATRARKLSREMAWVDFTQDAAAVSAKIRGLSPWPGVQVELIDAEGKPRGVATVVKCVAEDSGPHAPDACGRVLPDRAVACGTGKVRLLLLQPAGKKVMDAAAYANGYGFAPGAQLRSVVSPGSGT